ncbi:MAG: response regulator [Magnetococcales bacterium]|nr:response regulator [Magnetococcales bacterium]MBF0321721.1 response regulator [Magnetococcales bacterium]
MARILVMDDDPVIRQLLLAILQEAGHEVRTASDGRAGMALYKTERPDVVITDLLMPELDGVGVIRELQSLEPNVRIVALSGGGRVLTAETSLDVARRLGACIMVAKPFTAQDVLDAVVAALRPG